MGNKSRAITRLNILNEEFDKLIQQVARIDDSELLKKPSSDKWSVIQVFNHLFETEQTSYDYICFKENEKATFEKEKISARLKYLIYQIAFALPLRFKAPKFLSQPENEGNLEEIVEKFSQLRTQFQLFIERQNEEYFTKASYKHVVVGRIKLEKMFEFFKIHLKHHEKQILRTLIEISK